MRSCGKKKKTLILRNTSWSCSLDIMMKSSLNFKQTDKRNFFCYSPKRPFSVKYKRVRIRPEVRKQQGKTKS